MAICGKHEVDMVQQRAGTRNGAVRYRDICLSCESERRKRHTYSGVKKREWDRRNVVKRKAHKAVERALAKGEITKKECERCGDTKAHAHHEDYLRPLDVNWLCSRCHGARHRELRNMSNLPSVV